MSDTAVSNYDPARKQDSTRWHTDENRNAGRISLQLLVPAVPACTWDGCASLRLNETTPRSRGSRHSLHSHLGRTTRLKRSVFRTAVLKHCRPHPVSYAPPALLSKPTRHSTAHAAPHAPQLARRPHSRESNHPNLALGSECRQPGLSLAPLISKKKNFFSKAVRGDTQN